MIKESLRSLLIGAAVSAGLIASTGAANAAQYNFGDVKATLDSTVSVGTGIRTSGIDCQNVALDNGGCTTTGAKATAASGGSGYDAGVNNDDGNINSRRWNPYSTIAKITSELQLDWQNYGAFIRAKAYYDYWGARQQGTRSAGYGVRPLDDSMRTDEVTKGNNMAGHGFKLLDAFVYGKFDVGSLPLNVRLGNQVVNWGESLIIQGGLNSFLPLDVGAIRTPGAQLKDAYLPAPMIYAQLGLPANFGVEAFYEFGWQRTRIDSCGTFFSGSDAFCEGGAYVMNAREFNHPFPLGGLTQNFPGVMLPRIPGDYARDQGQYGVKGSYYADWLNDGTDMGLYYLNFHSNLPIGTFSAAKSEFTALDGTTQISNAATGCANALVAVGAVPNVATALAAAPAGSCLAGSPLAGLALLGGASTKGSVVQYVEDIHMLGFSFNTTLADFLGGSAFSGELAFSPNMPFQVADPEINASDLDQAKLSQAVAYIVANPGNTLGQLNTYLNSIPAAPILTGGRPLTTPGAHTLGYDRESVLTGQISTISTLSTSNPLTSALGADLIPVVFNIGFQYLPSLDEHQNHLALPRSGNYHDQPLVEWALGSGVGCSLLQTKLPVGAGNKCSDAQYATSFSSGYRLILPVQYNNAFNTAWTVTPSIQWAQDLTGYSAGPTGPGFIKGRKTITLGVAGSLQNTLNVSVNWTSSFGNKFQNLMYDKDFAQFNISYAF